MRRVPIGYSREVLLGSGRFGRVWRARQDEVGRMVALKEVSCRTAQEKEAMRREAAAIGDGELPCLPRLYSVEFEAKRGWIVQEYIHGVSISTLRATGLDPRDARPVAGAVVQAIADLHRSGRAHGDLDPGHLILEPRGRIRMIDLGFSTVRTESVRGGAVGYLAPEFGKGRIDPLASEIWGMGVLLHELLCGSRPGPQGPDFEALARHGSWMGVVAACLSRDPRARPCAQDILASLEPVEPLPESLLQRVAVQADVELAVRLKEGGREALSRGDGKGAWDRLQEAANLDPEDSETLDLLAGVRIDAPRRTLLPWMALAVAASLAVGLVAWWMRAEPPPPPAVPRSHRSVEDRISPVLEPRTPLPLREGT